MDKLTEQLAGALRDFIKVSPVFDPETRATHRAAVEALAAYDAANAEPLPPAVGADMKRKFRTNNKLPLTMEEILKRQLAERRLTILPKKIKKTHREFT